MFAVTAGRYDHAARAHVKTQLAVFMLNKDLRKSTLQSNGGERVNSFAECRVSEGYWLMRGRLLKVPSPALYNSIDAW